MAIVILIYLLYLHRWLHMCLVTKETVGSPTYFASLPFPLTFTHKKNLKSFIVISNLIVILITLVILIALKKHKSLKEWGNQAVSLDSLLAEYLLSLLCTTKFTKKLL